MNKEFNTTYTGVYSVPNYYFNNGVEIKLCCPSTGTDCRYLKILREIKELCLKRKDSRDVIGYQELLRIMRGIV